MRSVSVTDKDGKAVKVSKAADGTYSFTMPGSNVTVKWCLGAMAASCAPAMHLTDVDPDQWYHDAIDWAVDNGILLGEAGSFVVAPHGRHNSRRDHHPHGAYRGRGQGPGCRRAFLPGRPCRLLVFKRFGLGGQEPAGFRLRKWQLWSHDNLTREQLAVFLQRLAAFLGYDVKTSGDLSSFPDANKATYGSDALARAVDNGICLRQ